MTESPRRGGTVPPNPHTPEPGQEDPLAEWDELAETDDAERQRQPEQPQPRQVDVLPDKPLPPED